MKTVQQWLREVDLKELTDTFFWEKPIDYQMIPDDFDLTIGEIRKKAKLRFSEYVEQMGVIDLPCNAPEESPCIFFAIKVFSEGHFTIETEMTTVAELSEPEPEVYSWLLTDHAKVMGYYVAETELTLQNILVVLAQILHETSFFRYDQKSLEAERQKLIEAERESSEGKSIPTEEVWKKFGLPPKVPDPDAEAYEKRIRQAEWDYLLFSRQRELNNLRVLLDKFES